MLMKYIEPRMSNQDPFFNLFQKIIDDFFIFDDTVKAKSNSISYKNIVPANCRKEELANELKLSFELPGVKPEDLKISVEDQRLLMNYNLREKNHKIDYVIDDDYDAKTCDAKLQHGILELKFQKISKIKTKKIDIEIK